MRKIAWNFFVKWRKFYMSLAIRLEVFYASVWVRSIELKIIYSVPKTGERRQKWVDAINIHQNFDDTNLRYNLCELHFQPEDIIRHWKKTI